MLKINKQKLWKQYQYRKELIAREHRLKISLLLTFYLLTKFTVKFHACDSNTIIQYSLQKSLTTHLLSRFFKESWQVNITNLLIMMRKINLIKKQKKTDNGEAHIPSSYYQLTTFKFKAINIQTRAKWNNRPKKLVKIFLDWPLGLLSPNKKHVLQMTKIGTNFPKQTSTTRLKSKFSLPFTCGLPSLTWEYLCSLKLCVSLGGECDCVLTADALEISFSLNFKDFALLRRVDLEILLLESLALLPEGFVLADGNSSGKLSINVRSTMSWDLQKLTMLWHLSKIKSIGNYYN